jgi:hypothetical protein
MDEWKATYSFCLLVGIWAKNLCEQVVENFKQIYIAIHGEVCLMQLLQLVL